MYFVLKWFLFGYNFLNLYIHVLITFVREKNFPNKIALRHDIGSKTEYGKKSMIFFQSTPRYYFFNFISKEEEKIKFHSFEAEIDFMESKVLQLVNCTHVVPFRKQFTEALGAVRFILSKHIFTQ